MTAALREQVLAVLGVLGCTFQGPVEERHQALARLLELLDAGETS